MTERTPLLAICIPTYNRCDILKECLEDTISKVRRYNIPIIVSDNASTDDTEQVVRDFIKDYPELIYFRQNENIEADHNFETVLKLSPGNYSWLLGDAYRIVEEELSSILDILRTGKHCAVINNSFSRIKDIPSKIYTHPDPLLYDIGWHMTIICSLILSKDLVHNTNFARYYNTNFIQDGIIFEYWTTHPQATVYWYDKSCNTATSQTRQSWYNQRWIIFGLHWTSYILSLPSTISLETKLKCINQHNQKSRLFTFKRTILLRMDDHFNLDILKQCKAYQKYFWDIPYIVPYLIAVLPKWFLRIFCIV